MVRHESGAMTLSPQRSSKMAEAFDATDGPRTMGRTTGFQEPEKPIREIAETRLGFRKLTNIFMPSEQRFEWQKPPNDYDTFYDVAPPKIKTVAFGTSTRTDWEATYINKKDNYNPNAGPGNYNLGHEAKVLSTVPNPRVSQFPISSRPSMNLNTPSPGPAYNIEKVYRYGKESRIPIGFNRDERKPLADNLSSTTEAQYFPQLPKKPATDFSRGSGRTKKKIGFGDKRSPGPIYNVAKYDFRTGPSFSFGGSKAPRFDYNRPKY
mmetsp:Transcript_45983/g.143881  ORF Transcript_45983/g.143881 Transcript_45983/m.143881 type:complete len:265 (-) Transcript_45983:199-993(-)|eukprot:CAMPEP_0118863372 /NCGR_PEP_ID=MMETSP1163-20130328/8269_1 /TAXON_ID=124430 /ORGANISM="Phaeomonas parva, Strain CCMP2877" /LENGTH=264 /DNA_ID=CAMNT_0006797371 /DNA_START=81 /DNA_END=875 /DNA_ORIENTATION=+